MPTILIVDHQPVVRKGVSCLLREQFRSATLIEADGKEAALATLRKGNVELIVLEPDLPDTDGLRLINELQTKWPRTPVLVLTCARTGELARRALRAGAADFLPKAAPVAELTAMVASLLAADHTAVVDRTDGGRGPARVQEPEAESSDRHAPLSDRELQVLRLLAHGYSAQRVAQLLCISAKTVNSHRRHIYHKLGLATVSELTSYAYRHRLVRCRRLSGDP